MDAIGGGMAGQRQLGVQRIGSKRHSRLKQTGCHMLAVKLPGLARLQARLPRAGVLSVSGLLGHPTVCRLKKALPKYG